jgi:uncharacterized protein
MNWSGRDRRAFVDTSGFFAASSRRDEDHFAATATMQRLMRNHWLLVTTNFVIAELHALLLSRGDAVTALDAIDRIRSSARIIIVRVRSRDEDRALEILRQYRDKQFSFTDAVSFAVMERIGVTRAISLDHHFAQYGWNMIRVTVDEVVDQ